MENTSPLLTTTSSVGTYIFDDLRGRKGGKEERKNSVDFSVTFRKDYLEKRKGSAGVQRPECIPRIPNTAKNTMTATFLIANNNNCDIIIIVIK